MNKSLKCLSCRKDLDQLSSYLSNQAVNSTLITLQLLFNLKLMILPFIFLASLKMRLLKTLRMLSKLWLKVIRDHIVYSKLNYIRQKSYLVFLPSLGLMTSWRKQKTKLKTSSSRITFSATRVIQLFVCACCMSFQVC